MLNDFLRVGGNEVGNSARAYGYAITSECPAFWLKDPRCESIQDALGDDEYQWANVSDAPWYDPDDPDTSSRFLGVYVLEMGNLGDSTAEASIQQRIGAGASVIGYREAAREVRVRAWLTARGMDALEHGMTWLRNVLNPDACGAHGGRCGTSDMEFFVDCPPEREGETDEEWALLVDRYRRFLHSVRRISGPFTIQERQSADRRHYGRLVEFTLLAEVPWVYGATRPIEIPPVTPTLMQDIPYNLVEVPSAEVTNDPNTIVARNYVVNPSVENNATGWAFAGDGSAILTANIAGARSTELAAVGAASYRALWTAPGAGAGPGNFYVEQEVLLPASPPANQRYSVNLWAASIVSGGAPVLGTLVIEALWRAAGSTLRTDTIGTVPVDGGAASLPSILPPAGATSVIVRARLNVTSWNAGTIIRLYADAMGVTVP